jgi:N6-adenosine-specific RNA methylase IME4
MSLFADLPTAKYSTIVLDVPWPISMAGKRRIARHGRPKELPYKTLTLDEIKTFPVADLVSPGAHVYLWATNATLPHAFNLLHHWNLRYHLTLPLVKKSGIAPCNGYVFASEFCLLAFNGRPMQKFLAMGKLNWLVTNPTPGQHSRKPDTFYLMVEQMSPGPRLDCFSRRAPDGAFDCWGDQVQNGVAC